MDFSFICGGQCHFRGGKWTDASYLLGTEPLTEPSTAFGKNPQKDHMEVESVQIPGEVRVVERKP